MKCETERSGAQMCAEDLFTMAGNDQVKCPKSYLVSHSQIKGGDRMGKKVSECLSVSLPAYMQIIKIEQTNLLI